MYVIFIEAVSRIICMKVKNVACTTFAIVMLDDEIKYARCLDERYL